MTTFTTNIRNRNSGQGCLLSHACYCTDNKNRAKKYLQILTVLSSRHFVGNDLGSFLKYSGKKDFYAINIGSILPRHK